MTSTELILSIWSRRRKPWSAGATVKQVNFFLDLLRRERKSPPTREREYPIYGTTPPLALVVYPNGAGFVKVEDWAMTPDPASESKWRLKTEDELRRERDLRSYA